MNPKNRVYWLVIAHILAGPIVSAFCLTTRGYDLRARVWLCLFILLLCQGTLMGAWAVFSRKNRALRVVVTILSVFYLDLLANVSLGFHSVIPIVSMNTLATAGILSLLHRYRGLRGTRVQTGAAFAERAGSLRPSTRGLMLITGFVAALLAGARWLRELPREDEYLKVAAGFAGLVAVNVLSVGPPLGKSPPLLRGAFVIAASLALGMLCSYAVHTGDRKVSFGIIAGFPLQSALLQGSLLVVRSCGWRLVVSRQADHRPVVSPRGMP